MPFKKINIREVKESAVKMIGDEWALVNTCANGEKNTMTVSWGGMGELWGRDVVFVFIRPQRHSFGLIENSELFSLSFFSGEKKKELGLCGKLSGRDCNKFEAAGLTTVDLDGMPCVEQAKLNLVCRKIAAQDMNPNGFLDKTIEENYSAKDYHKIYVGEILGAYAAD